MTAAKIKPVTKTQANKALAAIKEQFAAYIDGDDAPKLVMDFDWFGTGPVPTIVWEDGPYEWAIVAFEGHSCADATCTWAAPIERPAGVWTEPATQWALSIYREDS